MKMIFDFKIILLKLSKDVYLNKIIYNNVLLCL